MQDEIMTAERPTGARISQAEWDVRVKLAAAYRLVDYHGWTEQIYGHLTARVPGPENHFLINPWGLNYDEVTASNLVKIDVEGHVVAGGEHGVNFAGFIIHSAIHMTRSDENHVVMHTHTRAGMAIAALQEGLLPISMFATVFHNRLAYHAYEGASLYPDERERIVQSLGPHKAMILRNHGLMVVGKTVPECFLRLYRLERACQVQLDAAAAGTLAPVPADIADRSAADLDSYQAMQPRAEGEIEFAALMRKLDRIDDGYRH
ncbi:class II aldolase/adducin family protein [Rhodopila sp.]|uniref:class II aldolase/adducin family protein n=1 Tax=Rhodopila sp. TaxID=2480087 RepID=UPI003D13BED2